MSQLTIDVPDETLLSLRLDPEAFASEMRLAAAMKLYEMGRLSSGAASLLAGIPRVVFLGKLADFKIPTFRQDEEDLKGDLSLA